jgi:acyl-CoA reductase-like NAD-dependent aldehyde dehydrogenase
MITDQQRKTVQAQLNDARKKGAKLTPIGQADPQSKGNFLQPVIATNLKPNMAMITEETFGPVIAVHKVKNWQEAVVKANESEFGLSSSVWTEDIAKGKNIAAQLNVGSCMVNNCIVAIGNPALPFGGNKNSGIGRYHGTAGLDAFTNAKAVMYENTKKSEPTWFPYSQTKYQVIKSVLTNYYCTKKSISKLIKLAWAGIRFLGL